MKAILETKRLVLREMVPEDFDALCKILQDKRVMYAYEHAFSDTEVHDWLRRQRERYRKDGFGLWAAIRKEDGKLIGQCGLTMQQWDTKWVPEIGYLFRYDCWHQGYATEAAVACKLYAFEHLGLGEVYSIIRDTNAASQRVAQRNGMSPRARMTKHYYGMDMPHIVYSVRR